MTARFFDANASLEAVDPASSVSVDIAVVPFEQQGLAVGFTRGYVQSFAIEALALVDHFETLDSHKPPPAGTPPPAHPRPSFPLEFTTSDWAKEFFDPHDLHCADRLLFA